MFRVWYKPRVREGDTGELCSVRVNDEVLVFDSAGKLETENQALIANLRKNFNSLFSIEEFEPPKPKNEVFVGETIEVKDEIPKQEDRSKAVIVDIEPKLAVAEMIKEEKEVAAKKDTSPEIPRLKLKLGKKKKRK